MTTISMPLRVAKINLLLGNYLFFLMALVAVVPAYSQSWSASGSTLYYNGGSVGIGTSTPGSYLLDVHGFVHTNLMFVADAPAALSAGAWFRGASNGSGSILLQGNSGSAAAFWLSGSSILKIGGNGSTEPAAGAINITTGGAVGIGTTAPGNIVDIETNTQVDGLKIGYNNSGMVRLHPNSLFAGAYNPIVQNGDAGITFGTTGTVPPGFGFVITPWSPNIGGLRMTSSGNVLIGKGSQTNTSYMLDVNGNARANEVVVNTTGADFVFDSAYHLSDLSMVAAYIKTNHHLPQIRSAAEMQKDGLDLGGDQIRLLQKIEELTLYIIDQNKRLEELKLQNQRLEDRNLTLENLEQRIQRLESLEKSKAPREH
jgi:hypothetical protein